MLSQSTQKVSFMIASHNAQSVPLPPPPSPPPPHPARALLHHRNSLFINADAGAVRDGGHARGRPCFGFKQHRFWAGDDSRNGKAVADEKNVTSASQLLGMKDVITLGLAKRGFNVHKYLNPKPKP
jgi:hypothetical protein